MVLNEQKGNMYNFITHTWNPIKGKCWHDCSYCYMKKFKQKPIEYGLIIFVFLVMFMGFIAFTHR